ncbi:MAG: S-methyl-5'-thioadenosine phosphorylase [Bacillota bacterium]|jgi:5'-methylthioadenosine phosphorylase
MSLGIISGTGLYEFALMSSVQEDVMETPYGQATVYQTDYAGQPVVFLPRHGKRHSVPPHLINYRANIYALVVLGVKEVISLCCVGSLAREMSPGSLVLLEQFIDNTWGRECTFSAEGLVDHVDMTEPYCSRLGQTIMRAAQSRSVEIKTGGVYLCTQGPRFETPAEIKAYALWGANLIGMTGVPEAPLAREAGLCYASLAVVANYAAGMNEEEALDVESISNIMGNEKDSLESILEAILQQRNNSNMGCSCAAAKIAACNNWSLKER